MTYQRTIIDKATIITVFIYILYTFWYQYAFAPIAGLLSAIGVLMLILSNIIIHKDLHYYKHIYGVVVFVLFCALTAIVVSNNTYLSLNLLLQIVKYCIPLYAIYVYAGHDGNKLDNVMITVLLGCTILAIWSFYKPIYTMTYTSVLSTNNVTLNANMFSSYMMLGVMACTYFLRNQKGINKVLLYAVLVTMLIAQMYAASRRGILVCVLLVASYFHSIITIKGEENKFKKVSTIILVFAIVLVIANELSRLADSFIVIQRFQGLYVGGDAARRYYQDVATRLFLSSPLFGNGLGAVSNEIGMYSHSLYFELLACTGIIGTLIMLIYILQFIIFFWKKSSKRYVFSSDERLFWRIMFWNGVALLVCGYAVVLIYDSYFYILLAVFACAKANADKGYSQDQNI